MVKIKKIKTQNNNYLINIYEDYCYIDENNTILRTVGGKEWLFADNWSNKKEEIEISLKLAKKLIKEIEKINSKNEILWELWDSEYDCLYETFYSQTSLNNHLKKNDYGGDERIKFIHPNLKNHWVLEEFEDVCEICNNIVTLSYTDGDRDVLEGYCHHCDDYISKVI